MAQERNSLKAGLFIIASIALVIAIIIGIKGIGRFLEPMQQATVNFKLSDDIGGLSLGDEVRIGGAKVGMVRGVEFVGGTDDKSMIEVRFTMPRRFVLHKDAAVSIQSTVTGVSVLNFSSLGTGEPLAAGDALVGRPAALNALLESGPEIAGLIRDVRNVTVPKANATIDTYRQTGQAATDLIVQVRGKVDPVVERYNAVADVARSALSQVNDLFGDTKTDLRTLASNLRDITGTVREKLPGLVEKADTLLAQVSAAIKTADEALQDVKQIATNTRDATGAAKQILVNNKGRIDAMIASLKITGDNLKGASAEVRRSPWRLLYKPAAGEMANLNLYDSARQFADGATQLNEASLALRDALKDPNTDKVQLQKLVDRLDKTFSNFNEIEQQLWVQVKE